VSKERGFRKYWETAKFLGRLLVNRQDTGPELEREVSRLRVMWGRTP